MITIRVAETDTLTACDISDLEAELDEISQKVNIYYKKELLGTYVAVFGISEDNFIEQIAKITKQKED